MDGFAWCVYQYGFERSGVRYIVDAVAKDETIMGR
jgi:hypothetical protein